MSASPRIVDAPSAASAETAASSSAPSGRSDDGGGRVDAQDLLHHREPRRLLSGEISGETAREQRGDGRGGERHGRDVDQRGCHRLAELRQQRVGVGRAAFALRNPAAVRALVAVRHPGELVEQGRLDDQVDRADLLPARQSGECGYLRAEGSGRSNGCLEVGVDQQPVRVERDGCRQLDGRRSEERHLGDADQEDHGRINDGHLGATASKVDPHRVDQGVAPADAADGGQVHGRPEAARRAGLERVVLGNRDGEDRELGSRREGRLVRGP